MVECSFINEVVVDSNLVAVPLASGIAPVSMKDFLDIPANTECEFILKCVSDMITRYSQMHRADNYSPHSSIFWSVWPNGLVFVYQLSGCGFEFPCSH